MRKLAHTLKAGDRIIFTEDIGGEGETLTVDAIFSIMGTVGISTEECDFAINTQPDQWITIATDPTLPDGLPQEFLDKRQSLAMFLLAMATGMTWEDADGVDFLQENYTKDADDVLRAHPHLLGLETRESMEL